MPTTFTKEIICKDEDLTQGVYPYTKVDCVSDENGTALSNLLLYHGNGVNTNLVPLNADLLNGYSYNTLPWNIDLNTPLYTNSSPTTAFSGQTIYMDLTKYKAVFITCFDAKASARSSELVLVGGRGQLKVLGNTDDRYFGRRDVTVYTDRIVFGSGLSGDIGQNLRCIPQVVYGIY